MNILVLGNGFDLAHYLPTKYDHFMGAMQAVEAWNISKGEMNFDELFKSFYQKESWFFGYTKAMYKTDEIKLTIDQIKDLQSQLEENVWYHYFSDHVKELKTWIDFETKIEEALEACCDLMDQSVKLKDLSGRFYPQIRELSPSSNKETRVYLSKKRIKLMLSLNILFEKSNENKTISNLINDEFIENFHEDIELAYNKIIQMLYEGLDNLISLFNIYLREIIEKLDTKQELPRFKPIGTIDELFSFNYTTTFDRLYKRKVKTDFIHGKSGDEQNIVLGISDLSHDILKKFKAYGFVKYHQKLMKNTDYRFVAENKVINSYLNYWQQPQVRTQQEEIDNSVNLTFWGHSLDVSDRNYIEEIFTLNDEKDLKVRVLIYYYNAQAKFSMLANLIHILGNKKVETWMKKGWLKFDDVPNIAEINKIEPVALV